MLLSIKALLSLMVIFRSILCDMKCSDVDICPKYKPYCSRVGCVFECPGQFYINGTNCVLSCGDWYIHDQKCVRQCPETWFVKELLTLHNGQEYMEKKCVENCNTFEYVFNNTCVEACPLEFPYVNNRNCSAHCPDDKHLLQNFSINSLTYFKCVNVCPRLVNDVYCADKCVEKLVLNSTCVEKCPEAFPFISEMKCVETCPDTTVYIDKDVCLQNCSTETPFVHNQTCIKTCPESFYITNRNGIIFCEERCRDGEYTYKNTCLHSCAYDGERNYYLLYLNKTCQEKCPSDYLEQKYSYPYVGVCVKTCSQDKFVYNGSCVDRCPISAFLVNRTCVHECPSSLPMICATDNDLKCTATEMVTSRRQFQMCVSMCPHDTFIFNKTCVNNCPLLYSVLGQDCMSKCPEQYPFVHNKTLSYKYCSDYTCWNYYTTSKTISKCVSECPGELLTFNSTCVLECPPSHHYIENRTCKLDGCLTGYQYNKSSYIICTDSCEDADFILNNTCVEECPDGTYITDKTCHLNNCQSKYTYDTSTATICTNDCTQFGFLNENVCVEQCPKYVFNDTCLPFCPDDFTILTNKTREVQSGYGPRKNLKIVSYFECRNGCSEYMFRHRNACLHTCPTSYYVFEHTCVSRCPTANPFQQYMSVEGSKTDDKETTYFANFCVKRCEFPRYLSVETQYACVTTCPNETNYIHQNVCTTGCPEGNAALTVNEGIKCVDQCPHKYVRFNDTCLTTCPKYTYNYHDSRCVFECPKVAPLGLKGEKWRCITSCSDSYKIFKNGNCIYKSNCDEPYFIFGTSCVLSCPDGYFWSKQCVKRWDTTDTAVIATLLGVWVVLLFWSGTALKEYFIVLSMILFKTDESNKKHMDESIDDENAETTVDDRQPLLTHDNEPEEV